MSKRLGFLVLVALVALLASPLSLLAEAPATDDPDLARQWGLTSIQWQGAYGQLGGAAFAGAATVAIIDTGADLGHPDLVAKLVEGQDFLDGDADPADTYGQGTHVAGIVAAATNNALGIAGVGFGNDITIMPLRVCSGSTCLPDTIAQAISYASGQGAEVILVSVGTTIASPALDTAIEQAWAGGAVVVVAAGNQGAAIAWHPADHRRAIAVGSVDQDGARASYSNYGPNLDVVAPGGTVGSYHDPAGIYSTMPTYAVTLTSGRYRYANGYDTMQGTAQAAAHVAGLAALLIAQGVPSNAQVRDIIESTAGLGGGWDDEYGWGLIDANAAVEAALGTLEVDPRVTILAPAEGATIHGQVAIRAAATDDDGVAQVDFYVDSALIGSDTDGSDGWSISWDSARAGNGPHILYAKVGTAAGSIGVQVSNLPPMHIGDLDGVSAGATTWTATVTIAVHDGGEAPVAGALVSGSWSAGDQATGSCITNGDGLCSVTSGSIGKKTTSVVWRVTNVTEDAHSYDPAANHDADGDSAGSSITVRK